MDRWFCFGIDVAANALGEHRCDLLSVLVLSDEVPDRVSVEALSASFSAACDLGSSPGFANDSDDAGPSDCSGGNGNDVDAPCVEQGRLVGVELGAALAYVVHGCDGAERWQMEEESVAT